MGDYETVLFGVKDQVAIATLDRPKFRDRLTHEAKRIKVL